MGFLQLVGFIIIPNNRGLRSSAFTYKFRYKKEKLNLLVFTGEMQAD